MPPAKRDFSHSSYGSLPFDESAILLPFGRASFLPALVERSHAVPIPMGHNTDRLAYTIERGAQRLTLIYSGMGSPAAANAIEKAAANGVRRLVLIGPCGGASPEVQVGDLIVPSTAIRGEGTSRYYLPAEIPATTDRSLCDAILAAARCRPGVQLHHGVIYTTDASYRQGPEVYENPSVLAVDCECAAAFIVAKTKQMRTAAVLFCTDNVRLPDPAHQKRQGLENSRVRQAFEAVVDCAIEALESDCRH